jgi:hypothetical protein
MKRKERETNLAEDAEEEFEDGLGEGVDGREVLLIRDEEFGETVDTKDSDTLVMRLKTIKQKIHIRVEHLEKINVFRTNQKVVFREKVMAKLETKLSEKMQVGIRRNRHVLHLGQLLSGFQFDNARVLPVLKPLDLLIALQIIVFIGLGGLLEMEHVLGC